MAEPPTPSLPGSREQFEFEGQKIPDYANCVAISTAGAQREMILPAMLAIVISDSASAKLGALAVIDGAGAQAGDPALQAILAEAGANPISQLAFTLANGFTYVEYYLGRGMNVDDFAPNLSFFFSNGVDPEYAVIGRVARRIWAKAIKLKYGADERAQKLKYHIQTSGRSLHAQEIDFNDIRTTLQARNRFALTSAMTTRFARA